MGSLLDNHPELFYKEKEEQKPKDKPLSLNEIITLYLTNPLSCRDSIAIEFIRIAYKQGIIK